MKKNISYEDAVKRLNEIVKRLERGDVPLEEALKLYREGTGLVRTCSELLNAAELEIVKLTTEPDGSITETEFDDGAE